MNAMKEANRMCRAVHGKARQKCMSHALRKLASQGIKGAGRRRRRR